MITKANNPLDKPPSMPTVIVNDVEVEVGPKDNVVQAARRAGVEIPHYCWHHELSVVASCRMCLVEVGERKEDGSIVMGPKLVPACQTPIKDNTVIKTDTPKVKQSQQMTLEFLLLNHPLDCSICDQAGECYLQDYTYKYGKAHSRLDEPKVQRMDKYHIGDQIALFTDRCVMCTRCVRFTREISGTAELQVVSRGSVEEIDVFADKPCNNKLAGNVVDLCPVGALCSKDFLYKKRVWWLKSQNSVCADCSNGCSIVADQNENKVYRLRPRENPKAQGSFMCDDGRFGFKYIHSENRLTRPTLSAKAKAIAPESAATNGAASSATPDLTYADPWIEVLNVTRRVIAKSAAKNAKNCLAVLSPMMTVEEAYLLANHLKSINKEIRLALGPVLDAGSDDVYPKLPNGSAVSAEKARFTIKGEKVPNRKGVEAVLKHFEGKVASFKDFANVGRLEMLYLVGGYAPGWFSQDIIRLAGSAEVLIVQDILSSELTAKADIVLASGSYLERDGTYVNFKGLAQAVRPIVRSPGDARSDGRILSELCERRGLFNAKLLRQEIAAKIPSLAALSVGDLGTEGVFVSPQVAKASEPVGV
jgi:NADH-quinone oxidoreductase subunit G